MEEASWMLKAPADAVAGRASRFRRACASDEGGQAFVEFALVLPVLMIVVMTIVKLGIVLNNYITLNDAVRAGARQLAISRSATYPAYGTNACAYVQSRVATAASSLNSGSLTVNPSVSSGSCNPDTSMVQGSDAVVNGTYPCDLNIFGIDFKPGCTLSATTTERVE
jgi:Flp pilus assembly protein TadG